MASYDSNVYYNPEKWDLTPVDEIELSSGDYEFDIVAVWKHSSGTLYTARSSGCSCPTPFEEFDKLEDLEVVHLASLENEINDSYYSYRSDTEKADFLRKVGNAG